MQQSFFRSPLALDTNQKFFKQENPAHAFDESAVDHTTLDSGLEMSPHMADSRRESFAAGSSLFSPKTETWDSVEMQSVPSTTGYSEHPNSNNPFMRLDQTQAAAFGAQATPWGMASSSGTCTPIAQFDGMADFDHSTSIFQRQMAGQAPFNNPNVNIFAGLGSVNTTSAIINPTVATAGLPIPMPQRKDVGAQGQKKLPPSPTLRSHNDLRRGDGIRKKNARFEIPPDRNLSNIDQLISQSTDEQEIKELKQQKRLLRNRQAA
jgi:hypothetical protein